MNDIIQIETENIKQLPIDERVKEETIRYVSYLEMRQKRLAFGVPVPQEANHHLLLGWVGDSLGSLCQSLARIFCATGILPTDRCVVTTAQELAGEYIGETAAKTQKKIEESLGGLLVVDGALIKPKGQEDFSMEMINSLLRGMENHSKDLVVVLTSDSIEEFLRFNPAFASHYKTIGINRF